MLTSDEIPRFYLFKLLCLLGDHTNFLFLFFFFSAFVCLNTLRMTINHFRTLIFVLFCFLSHLLNFSIFYFNHIVDISLLSFWFLSFDHSLLLCVFVPVSSIKIVSVKN
ncbi:hypothetical protein OIU74_024307 [Salix koriyanagi]|uniref:Uncharacterized protein n=1 Tax=Salix koriyanagi TaxID=2511006 RepID=A0A9Q0W9H9_9ROSI|nr:hypothetical protein OIU74_024307 [Salix koriyanagi]